MQRYFGSIIGKSVVLNEDDVFHICKVMRAKLNDKIEVVCDGKVHLCKITSFKPFKIEVISKIEEVRELTHDVILICSLIKGEKMDLVIQKATELGASEIVLLSSERSIVKIKISEQEKKLIRFRKIAKEASEQCHRLKVPEIKRIIQISDLANISAKVKMIAYENMAGSSKSFFETVKGIKKNQSVAIVIGPEGGFADYEVKIAIDNGFAPVSLGNRILRAETAAFYALSVISCFLEK